jgi:geranylgeranyl pyrophosphate synthase
LIIATTYPSPVALDFDAAEFEHRLRHSALSDSPPALHAELLHVLEAGGKRLRPILVYHFGNICEGPPRPIIELALGVEMLHTATLVHDDIIDSAESRRGRPTLHMEHGGDVALLVGDLYVARCGVHLAATEVADASRRLFTALDLMVRGELEQRLHRFDLDQTPADYMRTVQHKTASLIEEACAAAVVVSGGKERLVEAARDYGRNIGLAFQVVDDLLDYTGTEDTIGKPVAGDIKEGTVTLPLILAKEMSPAPIQAILASARERGDYSAVIQAVRRSGAVERCLELADELSLAAIDALGRFSDGPERQALADLATSLASRRA